MRRVLLFLLALMVLAPSTGSAATLYRCGGDHALRASCCCAPKTAHRHDDGATAVRKGCCCELVHVAVAPGPAREHAPVAAIGPATAPQPIAIAPAAAPVRIARADRGPREGVGPPTPLFVVHCALLL